SLTKTGSLDASAASMRCCTGSDCGASDARLAAPPPSFATKASIIAARRRRARMPSTMTPITINPHTARRTRKKEPQASNSPPNALKTSVMFYSLETQKNSALPTRQRRFCKQLSLSLSTDVLLFQHRVVSPRGRAALVVADLRAPRRHHVV